MPCFESGENGKQMQASTANQLEFHDEIIKRASVSVLHTTYLSEADAGAGCANITSVDETQFVTIYRCASRIAKRLFVTISTAPERGGRFAATPGTFQAECDRLTKIVRRKEFSRGC